MPFGDLKVSHFRSLIPVLFILFLVPKFSWAQQMVAWESGYEWLDDCTLRLIHKSYYKGNEADMSFPTPPNPPKAIFKKEASLLKKQPEPLTEWELLSFVKEPSLCPTTPTTRGYNENSLQYADYTIWEAYYYRDYKICHKNSQSKHALTVQWKRKDTDPETPFSSYLGNLTINPSYIGTNKSPIFEASPLPFICSGQAISFGQNAYDPDGDSISYALISPPEISEAYSSLHPLGKSWEVNLDGSTGTLVFTPSPQGNPTKGLLFLRVFEWRRNQIIGSVERVLSIEALEEGCVSFSGHNIGETQVDVINTRCNQVTFAVKPPVNTEDYLSYEWFGNGNLGNNPNRNQAKFTHTYPSNGNYLYRVRLKNIFGCTHTLEGRVVISNGITANAGEDRVICSGEDIELGSSYQKGYMYNWSPKRGIMGAQLPNPRFKLFNNTKLADTLTLKLEARSGSCKAEDFVNIVVSPAPQADIAHKKQQYCVGEKVELSLVNTSHLQKIQWQNHLGDVSIDSVYSKVYSQKGEYTVQAILSSAAGCVDTIRHSFTVHPVPKVDFIVDNACQSPSTFQARYLFQQDTTADYIRSWSWDFGDSIPTHLSAQIQNPSHKFPRTGVFRVQLTAKTNKGCLAKRTKNIRILPPVRASFDLDSYCEDTQARFIDKSTGEDSDPILSWFWDFGDGTNSINQFPMHVYEEAGQYRVMQAIRSQSGCTDTVWRNVHIYPSPTAAIESPGEFCLGDTIAIMNVSKLSQGNIIKQRWKLEEQEFSADAETLSFSTATIGKKTLKLTVLSDKGCEDSYSHEVLVHDSPKIQLKNDFVCLQESAQLSASSSLGTEIYWYASPQASRPIYRGNTYETQPLQEAQTYYVQATNEMGCSSQRLPIIGATFSQHNVRLTLDQPEVELPKAQVAFQTESSIPIIKWEWDFGDGNLSNQPNPVHEYSQAGSYQVQVTVTEQGGCELLLSDIVQVSEGSTISVPGGFSPNADGTNDFFAIDHHGLQSFSIHIYDRLGKLVFNSENPNFKWFGTDDKGNVLEEGIYVYVIEAQTQKLEPISKSQQISLVR